MATGSARARPDLGRLVMIPVAVLMLTLDLVALTRHTGDGAAGALRWLGTAGFCGFYTLIVWCYLRRGTAVATGRSVTGHAAAVAATFIPFLLPLLPAASPGPGRQLAAALLVLAGVAWSVWSLRTLGTSLSVVAQARDIVDRGPYRWVRHPLYAGELVSSLGLAVAAWSAAAAGIWLTLCALQAYRALREEEVLVRALPGYRVYRARTAALVPGIL